MSEIILRSDATSIDKFALRSNTIRQIQNFQNSGFSVSLALSDQSFANDTVNVSKISHVTTETIKINKTTHTKRLSKVAGVIAKSATPLELQEKNPKLTVINAQKLRFFRSKHMQSEAFPKNTIPTIKIGQESIKIQTFKQIKNWYKQFVVVKPSIGAASKLVAKIPSNQYLIKKEITRQQKLLRRNNQDQTVLVQPFFNAEQVNGLAAKDAENARLLEKADLDFEIRIFCSITEKGCLENSREWMYAVGRHLYVWGAKGTKFDRWINLKQKSVPKEAWELAAKTAIRLLKLSCSKGAFMAVDLIQHEGEFRIMEINLSDPVYPTALEDPQANRIITQQFVNIFGQ